MGPPSRSTLYLKWRTSWCSVCWLVSSKQRPPNLQEFPAAFNGKGTRERLGTKVALELSLAELHPGRTHTVVGGKGRTGSGHRANTHDWCMPTTKWMAILIDKA